MKTKKIGNNDEFTDIQRAINSLIDGLEALEKDRDAHEKIMAKLGISLEALEKQVKKIEDWLEIEKIEIPPSQFCECTKPHVCPNCYAWGPCHLCHKPIKEEWCECKVPCTDNDYYDKKKCIVCGLPIKEEPDKVRKIKNLKGKYAGIADFDEGIAQDKGYDEAIDDVVALIGK